jgi:hypothetical protein
MRASLILSSILSCGPIFAQDECLLSPALEVGFPVELPESQDFCFDISQIISECIPVYVRTNIHFFLNDECGGELATAPYVSENLQAYNAFSLAESLIDNANIFFEKMSANLLNLNYQWHSAEHGAPITSNQCIPIRYVLAGVYVHCSTLDQDVTLTEGFSSFNDYEINPLSEINVFVSNFITGNGNGFANNVTNQACIENFTPGLFNHELGHVFSLNHTFVVDLCDDTWRYDWGWDSDCDTVDDVFGNKCWDSEPSFGNPPNDLDACDEALFCTAHPCCDWTAQNNNLMTYSAWGYNGDYSALTPCQLNLMVTDISDNMCDYVADVHDGCPPPSANIGILPTPSGQMDCPACFYLNASYNESIYSISILNSNGYPILETGEIEGEVGKYCIIPR